MRATAGSRLTTAIVTVVALGTAGTAPALADAVGAVRFVQAASAWAPPAPDASITAMDAADVNGDGHIDFVGLLHVNAIEPRLVVLPGTGTGELADPLLEAVLPVGEEGIGVNTQGWRGHAVIADLDGDGNADVAAGTAAEKAVRIFSGDGHGAFAEPVVVPVADRVGRVRAGDLDGDGDVDLVAAHTDRPFDPAFQLSVLWNGEEGFTEEILDVADNQVSDFVLADVDGANGPDVVVTGGAAAAIDGLYVFRNSGEGSFAQRQRTETREATGGVDVVDLDGDGDLDVLVRGWALLALRNDGTGTFTKDPGPLLHFRDWGGMGAPHHGPVDLDGDGNLDLLTTVDEAVVILHGTDQGTFVERRWGAGTVAESGSVVRYLSGAVVVDGDGDDAPDVWAGSIDRGRNGEVTYLAGDPDRPGAFTVPQLFGGELNGSSDKLALADWDSDGHLDVLGTAGPGTTLWRYPGLGDGTLGERTAVGALPRCSGILATADFDRDGNPDVACTSGQSVVAFGDGQGGIAATAPITNAVPDLGAADGNGHSLAITDFNGDTYPDVAVYATNVCCAFGEPWRAGISVSLYNPEQPRTFVLADGGNAVGRVHFPEAFAAGDFDADGRPDLVTHTTVAADGSAAERFLLFKGSGDGTFAEPVASQPGINPIRDLEAVDLNGDSNLDLIGWADGVTREVLLGRGDGTFARTDPQPGARGPIRIADVTGDGVADFVQAGIDGGGVVVGRADGNGGLHDFRQWHPGHGNPQDVAVGDLDGDGLPELVTLTSESFPVSVLRNEGVVQPAPTDADLRVTGVVVPAEADAGDPAGVTYRVTNAGVSIPPGTQWVDRVYLSSDQEWDPADTVVASVTRSGGLAADGSYEITVDAPLLPPAVGTYAVIVRSDVGESVLESDEANTVVAGPLDISVPDLAPGDTAEIDVAADDHRFVRVTAAPGDDTHVDVTLAAGGVAEVLAARGRLPSAGDADLRAAPGDDAVQRLLLPADGGDDGDWFVLVRGRSAAGAGRHVTLDARRLGFEILSTTPERGSDEGTSTITVTGGGFAPGVQAALTGGPDGATLPAALVERPHRTSLAAEFALGDVPLGRYDLTLTNPDGESVTAFDAFVVEPTPPGRLEIHVTHPERLRVTQRGGVSVVLRNSGGTDVAIPELRVVPNGLTVLVDGAPEPTGEPFSFQPTDPGGPLAAPPAGRIPPGEQRELTLTVYGDAPGLGKLEITAEPRPLTDAPVDVVPVEVHGPAAVTPGERVDVSLRLRNRGEVPQDGPFQVFVGLTEADPARPAFLSTGPLQVGEDVALEPGESTRVQTQVVVPAAIGGAHRWAAVEHATISALPDELFPVEVGDVPVLSEEAVTVTVPTLGSAPVSGSLASDGLAVFAVDEALGVVDVAVGRPDGTGGVVRVADGYAPTAERNADEAGTGDALRLATGSSPHGRYVTVSAAGAAGPFEVTATPVPTGIDHVRPTAAGNAGSVTVRMSGSGLSAVTGFQLDGPGGPLQATSFLVESDVGANATFDLDGVAAGSYTLTAAGRDAPVAVVPGALTVSAGGAPELDVRLDVADEMRAGQPATVTVTYRNTGTVDARLPLVRVEAEDGGELRYLSGGEAGSSVTIVPPAVVPGSPLLPPGAVGRMHLEYTPTELVDAYGFALRFQGFDDPDLRDEPLDWEGLAEANPDGLDDAEWQEVLAEDRARYGETYGDLFEFLAAQIAEQGDEGIGDAAFVDGRWLWPADARPSAPLQIRSHASGSAVHVPAALRSYAAALRQVAAAAAPGKRQGRVWVLGIQGNDRGDLPGADKDMNEFLALMRDTYNLPASQLTTLRAGHDGHGAVTPQDYLDALNAFLTNPRIRPEDTLVILSNSHGVFDSRGDEASRALSLSGGRLQAQQLAGAFAANTSNPVLFINDSCYSGLNNSYIDQPNVATLGSSAWKTAFDDPSYSATLMQEWRKTPNDDVFAIAQRASDAQRPHLKRFDNERKCYVGRRPAEHPYDIRSTFARDGREAYVAHVGAQRKRVGTPDFFSEAEWMDDRFPVLDAESLAGLRISRPESKAWFSDNAPVAASTGGVVATRSLEPSEAPVDGCPLARTVSEVVAIPIVSSLDPNAIAGPAGAGPQRWVARDSAMDYTVSFENIGPGSDNPDGLPVATAPALSVTVDHPVPPAVDLDTVALRTIGFGATTVTVPAGRQAFSTRLGDEAGEAQAAGGDWIDVDARLDRDRRTMVWTFVTIDAATGLPADGADDGFLPPEDGSGAGRGAVTYTAQLLADAAAGTVVEAAASIVFDSNAPIATNTWRNTVDVAAPDSTVAAGAPSPAGAVPLTWSATDDGAGAVTFDVYVSRDGGPWRRWLSDTAATESVYAAGGGHTYGFAAAATDAVGHVEPPPGAADVTVAIAGRAPDPDPTVRCADPTPATRFPDVDAASAHAPAITCLADLGVVKGFTDGRFRPGRTVTREQSASFADRLATASGTPLPDGAGAFTDTARSVHRDAIERLARAGVVAGTAPGRFSPTATTTRGQMATMIVLLADRVAPGAVPAQAPDRFGDDDGDTHETSIDRLAAAGVVTGRANGAVDAAAPVSRAQMASFLARLLALVDRAA